MDGRVVAPGRGGRSPPLPGGGPPIRRHLWPPSPEPLRRHARLPARAREGARLRPTPSTRGSAPSPTGLAAHYGVALDELPDRPPDLALGAPRCTARTAPAATATSVAATARWRAGLDPAPANLADWKSLRDQSPLDFYRRVTIGVVGTAMPAFEDRLPARDRWAVALYAVDPAPAARRPAMRPAGAPRLRPHRQDVRRRAARLAGRAGGRLRAADSPVLAAVRVAPEREPRQTETVLARVPRPGGLRLRAGPHRRPGRRPHARSTRT